MIVAIPLLLALIAYIVFAWKMGNASVPDREREALDVIREKAPCTTVRKAKAYRKRP